LKLEEMIDKTAYLTKYNLLEEQIQYFLEQKILLKNNDFTNKTKIMFELAQSLY
jgi:hypothetical protein